MGVHSSKEKLTRSYSERYIHSQSIERERFGSFGKRTKGAAKKRDVRNLSISPTDLGPPPKTQQTANGTSTRPKSAVMTLTHVCHKGACTGVSARNGPELPNNKYANMVLSELMLFINLRNSEREISLKRLERVDISIRSSGLYPDAYTRHQASRMRKILGWLDQVDLSLRLRTVYDPYLDHE
uniref:Uncharacterized protein n=1 Tax=Glossina pallidipes TaxID=7398 RepID=A0A1B0A4E5_GLOPL